MIQRTLALDVEIRMSDYDGKLFKIAQEHPHDKIVLKVRGRNGAIAYYEKALRFGEDNYGQIASGNSHGKPDSLSYHVHVEILQPSETYLIEIDTTSIEGQDTSNYALFVA